MNDSSPSVSARYAQQQRRQSDVIIIGAGVGGLCAAIRLAASGLDVTILEAGPRVGGKAGVWEHKGVWFDTGPSVLTMPDVFDRVFRVGGRRLDDVVKLVDPSPAFRYIWPDGAQFDVFNDVESTLSSARETFGSNAEADLRSFLSYAERIWEAAAPNFVFGPAPSFGSVARLGIKAIGALRAIDSMRSMQRAIERKVRDPHIRDVLLRYATYNGSDPRVAPATLNCISWVELGLGGFGVAGGIYALIEALAETAQACGARIETRAKVESLTLEEGRVTGVRLQTGAAWPAQRIVVNADVAHLATDLLDNTTPEKRPAANATPSTSGWNAIVQARRRSDRVAHTVLFPERYAAEFEDMFDAKRAPSEPTVYLCAQEKAHARPGWPQQEPVFIMANAPAEPASGHTAPDEWKSLGERVLERVIGASLIRSDDPVVWERTPTHLARQFPGSRGAIYGAASNDRFAAFRRPANRWTDIPGLYLASGSAHPGGGLPLCAQSGWQAAGELLEDTKTGARR